MLGKAVPMLEEPPPSALLSSEVPGDCPLGGPTMGLAAALGFPQAFAGGAGAAFSALAYLGGCTTGPIPSELDIWGCLGEGPCTWIHCTYFSITHCKHSRSTHVSLWTHAQFVSAAGHGQT